MVETLSLLWWLITDFIIVQKKKKMSKQLVTQGIRMNDTQNK